MGSDKLIQRAGDGSQQLQAQTINVYNGVTEERVRAIFAEQSILARKEYTEDAYRIADERVGVFEEHFMPRITQIEDAMPSFADPAFQLLLRRAQVSAATTEREADYDLLTELLICHVQKGNERKNRTAINRAVEIVGEIDNDALCGLTVAYSFTQFCTRTGEIFTGIQLFNNLFEKLMYQDLPAGDSWLDHLDVLGAVRYTSFGALKKMDEILSSRLNGYICVGIKGDSEEYRKATSLLAAAGIPSNMLCKNECMEGYYRLPFVNKPANGDPMVQDSFSQSQIDTLNQIWDLYSKDVSLMQQAKTRFMEVWDHYDTLLRIRKWWDSIPGSFSITQIGRVLAHTNAKRCTPEVPDMI